MELVDTHCHLDVSDFDADRDMIITNCRQLGVNHIIIPGVDAAGWPGLLALCRQPGLYPALGLHPIYIETHREQDLHTLESLVSQHSLVAIGEIGLDYFVTDLDRAQQQTLFEKQLLIARDAGLPVLLHVRKAHDAVLATLKRIPVQGGIAHAFNGSLEQAQRYVDMGFKLGFGGMLTYERSQKLRKLAAQLPQESLVLETDAPDMTVARFRGQRNSPEYLPDCLNALAQIRGQEPATVAAYTTANARMVLMI